MKIKRYSSVTTDRQRYIWNMLGSLANALSSIVLLSIVSRTNGEYDGGIFSLAFGTAQLLNSVGGFAVRALQSTDITKKYPFSIYLAMRYLSCALMLVCGAAYAVYSWDTPQKAAAIILLCIYKAIDAYADVFQGLFQLNERIDLSGKELAFRVALSTLSFACVIILTGNLVAACASMVIVSLIWVLYYDLPIGKDFESLKAHFNFNAILKLTVECLPLFVGAFMLNYIVNAPKYAIDDFMNEEAQNTFGFLIMPAFVINLFSLFFFRPLLTKMARAWNGKSFSEFNKINIKCIAWVLILTAGGCVGAYLLGIPILNVFSGQNLYSYRMHLVIVMLGGGANALVTFLYYALACMRKQYAVFIGYTIGFVASLILSKLLVKSSGVLGGCIAYAASTALIVFVMLLIYVIIMFSASKQAKE